MPDPAPESDETQDAEDDARERRRRMKQRLRQGILEFAGSGIRPTVNRGPMLTGRGRVRR